MNKAQKNFSSNGNRIFYDETGIWKWDSYNWGGGIQINNLIWQW